MNEIAQRFAQAALGPKIGPAITAGTGRALAKRAKRVVEDPAWERLRERAREAKRRAIGSLDRNLVRLEDQVAARGGRVHWAESARSAREIVVEIARAAGVSTVTKSKSMVSEEIELASALAAAGIRAVETDLGEFIVQLAGARPTHIIAPAMDRTRDEIGRLFQAKLGSPYTDDARELTAIARRHLRRVYLEADMGVSGANFAVAETGTVVVVENEANARLTTRLPDIHVVLMGIEKVVETTSDLALLLYLLIRSATGQKMSSYVNHYTGSDRAFHLVLVDNGRTRALADPHRRELLHCIRCGACLNVCPVYQSVGGGPYDWVYPGPIGIALGPLVIGPSRVPYAGASSLCGACSAICPVKIDLAHHILAARGSTDRRAPVLERAAMKMFQVVMTNPGLYRFLVSAGRLVQRVLGPERLWPRGWKRHRKSLPIARRSFREIWQRELARPEGSP